MLLDVGSNFPAVTVLRIYWMVNLNFGSDLKSDHQALSGDTGPD